MNKIYLVVEGYYSDWHIIGYYTTREEAEKFCALNKEVRESPYVMAVNCLDGQTDVSNVSLKYEHTVIFHKKKNGFVIDNSQWDKDGEDCGYECYIDDYLRSNEIRVDHDAKTAILYVNQDSFSREKAEKIAQDLLYQYLHESQGHLYKSVASEFNKMLSFAERRRQAEKAEKELEEKELAELARLKAKYESE